MTTNHGDVHGVTVRNAIRIACPPEVVFDYLTDIEQEPEWNEMLEEVEPLTVGPLAAGSRYRVRFRLVGESVIEYVELDRPTSWATKSAGPRLDVLLAGRIVPERSGACRVELRTHLAPRGVLRLAGPFVGVRMRRSWDRHLRAVKERLETHGDTGAA